MQVEGRRTGLSGTITLESLERYPLEESVRLPDAQHELEHWIRVRGVASWSRRFSPRWTASSLASGEESLLICGQPV